MKTKNVALAVAAFTLALGSAFASMFTSQHVFVHARINDINGSIRCVDTNVSCDDAGSLVCTVVVPVTNGSGTQTAKTDGTSGFVAYKAQCATPLSTNNATPLNASPSSTIYELINP
jgi:hypothetical protein